MKRNFFGNFQDEVEEIKIFGEWLKDEQIFFDSKWGTQTILEIWIQEMKKEWWEKWNIFILDRFKWFYKIRKWPNFEEWLFSKWGKNILDFINFWNDFQKEVKENFFDEWVIQVRNLNGKGETILSEANSNSHLISKGFFFHFCPSMN